MKCPICKKEIIGYPAISRKDNRTEICSDCGLKQTLAGFRGKRKIYKVVKKYEGKRL